MTEVTGEDDRRGDELAKRWREMQAYGQQRLTEEGLSLQQIPEIARQVLKR